MRMRHDRDDNEGGSNGESTHVCLHWEDIQKVKNMSSMIKILFVMMSLLIVLVGWNQISFQQYQVSAQEVAVSNAKIETEIKWAKESLKRIEQEISDDSGRRNYPTP